MIFRKMLGRNFPAVVEGTQSQYDTTTSPQLQLIGNGEDMFLLCYKLKPVLLVFALMYCHCSCSYPLMRRLMICIIQRGCDDLGINVILSVMRSL